MKFRLLFFLALGLQTALLAQKVQPSMEIIPGRSVVEYLPKDATSLQRPFPKDYEEKTAAWWRSRQQGLQSQSAQKAGATFILSYDNATPNNVKSVFEYAASLWSKELQSEIPIRVYVQWKPLASNVLGSAGASAHVRNFPGAQRVNTFYPIALAEKISRRNLNGENPDLVASFNSDFQQWYFGTDGLPTRGANGQFDLLSVVMHEFGHGLGFIGQFDQLENADEVEYAVPEIFDHLMANEAGDRLTDTTKFKNPSTALFTAVTTPKRLFSDGPYLRAFAQNKATLYSPSDFNSGSSIYHLDQNSYPVGDPNALMIPFINRGEVTRDVGNVLRGLFKDMGWQASAIVTDNYPDSEAKDQDFIFEAKWYGDTILSPNSLRLKMAINTQNYKVSLNDFQTYTPSLVAGSTNTYRYVLPKSSQNRVISYYWEAAEASGKKILTPAEAPQVPGTKVGSFYQTYIGADTIKPELSYANPLRYAFVSQTSITLPTLYAADNLGIDTVYMEYAINNGSIQRKGLIKSSAEKFAYHVLLDLSSAGIKAGDVVKYRMVAKDKAKTANITYSPGSGFYEFRYLQLAASTKTYVSSFDRIPSADFYLKGFKIGTSPGFSSPALHSDHPYADGSEDAVAFTGGEDKFTNNDAVLLKPIVLRSDTAKIYFHQIALVEPGEDGVNFYDSNGNIDRYFFDYVIVQASKDQGKTWVDLSEGWDARKESVWLNHYNSSIDRNGNSTAVPSPSLFKPMEIDLYRLGQFKAGDELILRFRLHADVGANGWGWVIEDLNIQGPKGAKEQSILASQHDPRRLEAYPNPAQDRMHVLLQGPLGNASMELSIMDLQGRTLWRQAELPLVQGAYEGDVDVSLLPAGNYVLQASGKEFKALKKIQVIK